MTKKPHLLTSGNEPNVRVIPVLEDVKEEFQDVQPVSEGDQTVSYIHCIQNVKRE